MYSTRQFGLCSVEAAGWAPDTRACIGMATRYVLALTKISTFDRSHDGQGPEIFRTEELDVDGLTCVEASQATKTDMVYTEWTGDLSCLGLNRPTAATIGGSPRLSVCNVLR